MLANSGEDEFEEIFKLLIAKLFTELDPRGSRAFSVQKDAATTAASINHILAQASTRWEGILPVEPASRLQGEHLRVCVEALQPLQLADTNLEILDGLFEYLVSRSEKGTKGQFFTPRHVVGACIRILDPQPHEKLMDPACGSGGFLIHALTHMKAENESPDTQTYASENLWGFDFDQRAVRVAKALMLLAGDGRSNILRLNSLLTPDATSTLFSSSTTGVPAPGLTIEDVMRSRTRNFRGFDVIATNPPFAGEVRERHLLSSYELGRSDRRAERDVLFLERCVQLLRPGGRIAIVLPHNRLGAATSAFVRAWALQHLRIIAVVGLGRATFLPHTHQKTSVLFALKRSQPRRSSANERILFAVSEREGKDSRGQIRLRDGVSSTAGIWDRADHDLNEIVTAFHDFVSDQSIDWAGR